MNDYRLWNQGYRYYEQLKAIININDFGFELKALGAMNSLGLWMIRTILGHDLKGLDAMNSLRWLRTWTTPWH